MKTSTHILALLMVVSFVSLIGCSSDKSPSQVAQKCISMGPSCTQQVVSQYMTNPTAYNQAIGQAGFTVGANGQVLPVPGATQVAANGAPAVLPPVAAQAAKVQQGLREASANPMSSYYVDSGADDVPARSSISERLAALAVSGSRQPAAVQQQAPAPAAENPNAIQ